MNPRPLPCLAAASLVVGMTATPALADDRFFVYVSPDAIGVNAFLQMGRSGTEAAGAMFGAEVRTYESRTAAERRENVNAALDEGADVIVLLGFEFNDVVTQLAPTAPDTQFLIIDQCIPDQPDNVHCVVFREYEVSYLMGVAAAMMTEAGHVGVVGALDIPFLRRYTEGYAMGARLVEPDITVSTRWVGGENPFADPVRAKEQAVALHAAGADVIFTATAGGDFGVFEAAEELGFKMMAVDVNRCPEVPGRVIDNTLKGVDAAVIAGITTILDGATASFQSVGIAEGGMLAAALDPETVGDSGCLVADHPEVAERMREVAAQIVDGSLEIPDPMFAQ